MPVIAYQPLYTVAEAAEVLKTNKNYIYDLIKSKKLLALRLGSVKIRGSDLEMFIEGLKPEEAFNDSKDGGNLNEAGS